MPASFRSYLSSMGYNGVICYPSFNNPSIEGYPQNRIEKISESIESESFSILFCEHPSIEGLLNDG